MATNRTTKIDFERRPVWAEVSLGALKHNLNAIRAYVNPKGEKRAKPRKVLCIVKGNGYGHGGPQVAKALEKFGADWFGVTCTEEGIAVRKAGVKNPVLILTSFVAGEEKHLVKHDLTPVIHRCEQLADLNRAAARYAERKPISFHLKIDSGMNRLGIAPESVESFAEELKKYKQLKLEWRVHALCLVGSVPRFGDWKTDTRAGRKILRGAGTAEEAGSRSRNCALGEQRRDCFTARDLGGHGAARRDSLWVSPGL